MEKQPSGQPKGQENGYVMWVIGFILIIMLLFVCSTLQSQIAIQINGPEPTSQVSSTQMPDSMPGMNH